VVTHIQNPTLLDLGDGIRDLIYSAIDGIESRYVDEKT
jgi:hypothetical protein